MRCWISAGAHLSFLMMILVAFSLYSLARLEMLSLLAVLSIELGNILQWSPWLTLLM